MSKHNPNNERIKRQYFTYLKDAYGYSEATVDAVAKALDRFETDTRRKDFKTYHYEQAIAFKRHLEEQRNQETGKPLSKATVYATLAHLKRFFHWLAGQPGYKSRLKFSDADYFGLSNNDARVATAHRESRSPTLEQVKHVISIMPTTTDVERRDRALIAFTLLTGARDSAIASMRLRHVVDNAPPRQILFGTDATLIDPAVAFGLLADADPSADLTERILWRNAADLFALHDALR